MIYKASLIPKPDTDIRKPYTKIFHEYRCKNPQKILANEANGTANTREPNAETQDQEGFAHGRKDGSAPKKHNATHPRTKGEATRAFP